MKLLSTLLLSAAAGLVSMHGLAVDCSGMPGYSAGTSYAQDQDVQNNGEAYNCDIPGWCSSTAAWAYEPGAGSAWAQAWTALGSCDGGSSGGSSSGGGAGGSGDYGVEAYGSAAALFYVESADWADIHYILNTQGQQNFRMYTANGRQEWQLDGLANGDQVQYSFTYNTPQGAVDTPWQTYTHTGGGGSSSSSSSSGGSSGGGSFDPGNPSAGGSHPRLTIHNACPSETMWVHWLTVPDFQGGVLNAPNHTAVASGQSISYNIPDKGLAAMRFWPAFGCDGGGMNCRIGASGGPQEFGFTCPPEGCAPPIDSKFEATFGCITGIDESQCQTNPSGGGALGRSDWWNSSAVDGFTAPIKVEVNGYCPEGPVTSGPFAGPGGPTDGTIDCSGLRLGDCPRNVDLSTDGLFPHLSNMDLLASNPQTGAAGGCYSPAGKLTYGNWGNTPTYAPDAPEAQMYTCPTPPVSEPECRAGPADSSAYRNYIHSVCETYAYAYDDGFGLSSCPASTLTSYEVTFYCPE